MGAERNAPAPHGRSIFLGAANGLHPSRGNRCIALRIHAPYFFFASTGSKISVTGVSNAGIKSVFASNERFSLSLVLSIGRSSRAVSKLAMQTTSPLLARYSGGPAGLSGSLNNRLPAKTQSVARAFLVFTSRIQSCAGRRTVLPFS